MDDTTFALSLVATLGLIFITLCSYFYGYRITLRRRLLDFEKHIKEDSLNIIPPGV